MFYQALMSFFQVVARFHRFAGEQEVWQNPAWAV